MNRLPSRRQPSEGAHRANRCQPVAAAIGRRATQSEVCALVRRHVPLVELDRFDVKQADPFGLVAKCVLERAASVLFSEEQVASELPSSTSA
jgi:hypothetical protein